MPSLNFNSALLETARGKIDFETGVFKCMLTTSAYTENKDTHTRRSDVTNEISGTGYTAGGVVVDVVLSLDTATDKVTIVFQEKVLPGTTISARKAVYYLSRGGAASADELICVNDFGSDISTTDGTFTLKTATINWLNA